MRRAGKTTVVDHIAIIGCVALAMLTLGAVGESGRRRAKEQVCLSNLRQWGAVFQDYIEQNDGRFLTGVNSNGYWWPVQLDDNLKNWKANKVWFCPTAVKPAVDEFGVSGPALSIFNAWGVYWYYGEYDPGPHGLAGSYGLNGYALHIPSWSSFERGVPGTDGWKGLNSIPNAGNVPLYVDALRFDLWPRYTDSPSQNEFAPWSVNHMARCCINRHDGAVGCLFVDGSARKVGLKELWTLKWHRSFNTAGPWTKAGGVQSGDWPKWMRDFRDN